MARLTIGASAGPELSCDIRNRGDQFSRKNRLRHVRLEACRKGASPIVGACVTGQRNRRQETSVFLLAGANLPDERVPIFVREADLGTCRATGYVPDMAERWRSATLASIDMFMPPRRGQSRHDRRCGYSVRTLAEYRFSSASSLVAALGARTPLVTMSRFSSGSPYSVALSSRS